MTPKIILHALLSWCVLIVGGGVARSAAAFDINGAAASTIEETHFNSDLTPEGVAGEQHYNQSLRPQIHYSPIQGHLGDATGLIYYQDQYHLFYIYDEWQLRRDRHKRWGHAVSSDLIHWKQMPAILDTQRDNHPGSGSGTVDWSNCSGLQQGKEKTLMVFYTDYKLGTCISYSRDAGQTWAYYDKNPVLADAKDKRDPMVFWHKPTSKWCMVRYESGGFAFYNSDDLLHWRYLSRIEGFYECPDLMELPVDNRPGEKAWVLIDGDGSYFLGRFDGKTFTPESPRLKVDFGGHYATQTWKKPGDADSRTVQVAWMPYPDNETAQSLTWNGQLSFPCELYLRAFDGEVRLCREPIKGINELYDPKHRTNQHDLEIVPGENPLKNCRTDPCELVIDIQAIQGKGFTLSIGPTLLKYDADQRRLSCLGKVATIPGKGKGLYLQVLVDRSSVDVYAEHGRATLSRICFPGGIENKNLALAPAEGGSLKVGTLEVNYLNSMWAFAAGK